MLPSPSQNCFPDRSWVAISIPWHHSLTWHHWGEKSLRQQVSTLDSDKLPACQGKKFQSSPLPKKPLGNNTPQTPLPVQECHSLLLMPQSGLQTRASSAKKPKCSSPTSRLLVRFRTLWSLAPAGPSSCTFHCSSLAKSMPEDHFPPLNLWLCSFSPFPYLYLFKSFPSLGIQISPCVSSKSSQRTLVYIGILSFPTYQGISTLDHALRNLITYPLVQLLDSYAV